jgi:hypothetical protein
VRKRDRTAKFVAFYGPPALKRDLKRIARAEGDSLSSTVRALVRLGIERYFEQADAKMIAPLRALLEESLACDASFREAAGERPGKNGAKQFLARHEARVANDRQFDAAVEEGLRSFARPSTNGGRSAGW